VEEAEGGGEAEALRISGRRGTAFTTLLGIRACTSPPPPAPMRTLTKFACVSNDAILLPPGLKVLVLERRHVVGGAAVTEEVVPGFKFSRASYLAGLLRPRVIEELELARHGFQYLPRDPSSFTPTPWYVMVIDHGCCVATVMLHLCGNRQALHCAAGDIALTAHPAYD